jgi:hypothetical protein
MADGCFLRCVPQHYEKGIELLEAVVAMLTKMI